MTIIEVLLSILIISGIGLAVTASYGIINFIRIKTENKYINELLDVVSDVTDELSQTYVKSLKDAGTFSTEEQNNVLNLAVENIKKNLSDGVKAYLEDNGKDLTDFITTKIESYLWRTSGRSSEEDDTYDIDREVARAYANALSDLGYEDDDDDDYDDEED